MALDQERASLVADALVDLVRESLEVGNPFGAVPLTLDYSGDDGKTRQYPTTRTDGRPVALDYAMMELLVEIRDGILDPARARLARGTSVFERPKPIVETDGDELERRLAAAFEPLYLGGRVPAVVAAALDVFSRFLREKGLLA